MFYSEKNATDTEPASPNRKSSDALSTKEPSILSKPEEAGYTNDPAPSSTPAPVAAEPAVETPPPSDPADQDESEVNYKPKTLKFWLIMLSAFVSMLLVALDRTILSTAIPKITDDFDSLGDIGWYGSGYMLTTAAFQLSFGRIYRFCDLRWTFLTCIIIFEAGSALCGAAPSSAVFIVGRAVAGVGAAGIMTGAMMVVVPMVPLHKRPMFQSMFGLVFGIASVAGPLLGGALTQKSTWRWCFYMNLPVGVVAFACLFFFLKVAPKPQEAVSVRRHILRLDPLGLFFFIPCIVCLILALQWGGSTYPWSNWRLIVLFIFFGLAGIAFGTVQVMMPESASLPVRVIGQRTILAGTGVMLFLSGSMMLCVYYIPLWFQTTHGIDPVHSGIYTIPLVLSLVISGIIASAITQRIGYYTPAMIVCPCIMAVGEGLLTTFTPTTGSSHWIAYQFLVGFGVGTGMQMVGLAAQATLPKEDVPTGLSIMFFSQQLGGAIFVSVGQSILSILLVDRLRDVPGLDAHAIVKSGATDLHRVVPERFLGAVIDAYNYACTRIFFAALALSAAQLLCALCVEWRSIKKGKQSPLASKKPDSKSTDPAPVVE